MACGSFSNTSKPSDNTRASGWNSSMARCACCRRSKNTGSGEPCGMGRLTL
ncbi:Uncharacterised protein [Bordetella pertussis]|nr:Uncharacterised protein [Bordetella pertussis]